MSKRKNDGVSSVVTIVVVIIVWLAWVAVKAIINWNNKLIEAASSPAGIIALFFGLLILFAAIIHLYMARGIKQQQHELAERQNELSINEQHFDEIVNGEVEKTLNKERQRLKEDRDQFLRGKDKARKALQRIVDTAYNFKVKTLLAGLTVNNYQSKYDQLRKEADGYAVINEKISFLSLDDNADWSGVKQQFRDKVTLLEKAQEEKEHQAEIKRQMREEKQREDELERQQREAEDEEQRLAEQQRLIEEALAAAEGSYKEELERQRQVLEQQIAEVHQQYERAKSMAQLTKQGHVYVISNIGSFGENVFKVGMTRRLEPMDRVKELGDASVPFDFDVHAMISCDDAPALEKALHDKLETYRMNKVNVRKEFFRVELQRIIEEVKHHHGEVEYIADPVALQYYQSIEAIEEETVAA